MSSNLMRIILVFGLLFPLYAHANCSMSSRLKVDAIVNDVAMYAVEVKSLSKSLLLENGFENYDEFTYSSESYSNAILQIQNNHKTIGELYTNALKMRLKEKEPSINKALEKVLKQCTKKQLKAAITQGIWSTLSGTNHSVEYELMQLNLNAISDGMKAM